MHAKLFQSYMTLWSHGLYPPGSSVHGILQARILEWVAISFSRRASQPKDRIQVFCIAGRFIIIWATREISLAPDVAIKQTWVGHQGAGPLTTVRARGWTYVAGEPLGHPHPRTYSGNVFGQMWRCSTFLQPFWSNLTIWIYLSGVFYIKPYLVTMFPPFVKAHEDKRLYLCSQPYHGHYSAIYAYIKSSHCTP